MGASAAARAATAAGEVAATAAASAVRRADHGQAAVVVDEVERELGRVEAREDGLHREAALSLVARLVAAVSGDPHEVGIEAERAGRQLEGGVEIGPQIGEAPAPAIAAPRPSAPIVSLSEKYQPTGGVRTRCQSYW